MTADDALHPVEVVWAPPAKVDPPRGLRVDPRLLDHVAATVRRALPERDGDVLVFLPGAGEIDAGRRAAARPAACVRCTAARTRAEQDAVLRPVRAAGSCWPPRSRRAA